MAIRQLLTVLAAACAVAMSASAADAPAEDTRQPDSRAVMTAEQVVQILDETVDWYRTLGLQQQTATQPSDLLILYANRQTADKVVQLAFDIARANAELLSSDAELQDDDAKADAASSMQALQQRQRLLDTRRRTLQTEIGTLQRQIPAAPADRRSEMRAKAAEMQSELDLVNARRNLLDTMTQFVYQSDANGSGASALKAHIDAIAASIPSSGGGTAPPAPGSAAGPANAISSASLLNLADDRGARRLGIWDLTANVLRLSTKINTIDTVDQHTADLQKTFLEIRTPPLQQIEMLSARSDALARQADAVEGAGLHGVRDQFDTLAWLFKQTASILVPLSKESVLLDQYRHNLANWRESAQAQYHNALRMLALRVGLLLVLLAIVFGAAELWRRAVFRYIHESRRRYQLLLVRTVVLWSLVVAILGFTFATELGSLVTFAGLLTAGLAVAMQSVLVSIVGYFFLIGRYGIRVGDRVQIGNVTGEVIDLGLVRLHLMELSGQGPFGPTGRVVAFANSIVFQASGGIFKQIPGVNLAWHETTLTLPPASDYSALKERLSEAANDVIKDYHDDLMRQTKEIQKTTSSHAASDARPQVQLRFSAETVEAIVRYPVQIQRAAEIDERISRALRDVIKAAASS